MQKDPEDLQLSALLDTVFEAIRSKKGQEIIDLDITHLNTTICNHFIICHANSSVQTQAIGESIEKEIKKEFNLKPFHREGYDSSVWILLDYGDLIVHIFQEPHRRFYNLEELWGDGISKFIDS